MAEGNMPGPEYSVFDGGMTGQVPASGFAPVIWWNDLSLLQSMHLPCQVRRMEKARVSERPPALQIKVKRLGDVATRPAVDRLPAGVDAGLSLHPGLQCAGHIQKRRAGLI